MNDIILYIQIIVTAFCAVTYILTYRFQASKLNTMEKTVKTLAELINGQSKIISDFERYKSVFDIEDFEKRLALKLDNKEMEMNQQFRQQTKTIVDQTIQTTQDIFIKTSPEFMKSWEELSQIAISVTLKQFPTKADKDKRDEFVNKHYPENSKYFIGFIDEYLDGKIKM
jgi:hypothetical protein